ncbi:MAG: helix-turn-helix transcriptional regulator [Chloroflexi bacterium SZAS-1]|nr:helix-turn-helix transcriptional regulator [Chloroflexi bacterium SZAS-1]
MARWRIAQVIDDQLLPRDTDNRGHPPVAVGTAAWYAWLADQQNRSFSLTNHFGTFTVRRERQRNSWYWYIYAKRERRLCKAYLGKTETVSPARLEAVTATLARRQEAHVDTDSLAHRHRELQPPAPAHRGNTTNFDIVAAREQAGADAGWNALLKTKLAVPVTRANLVPREALISRLEAAIRCPLTLISAPAGFGKTTLLYDWIRHHQQPVAWLSLDVGDNVLSQIWRYVIAALHERYPMIDSHALAVLQAPQPHNIEAVLIALINAIAAAPNDVLLVLDDYHVIHNPAIHQALAFVIDHAPAQLRLVIASRTDPPLPLARLRARGVLAEVRDADLRLNHAEALAFLSQAMGLVLSAEDAVALTDRTEGWIVGLQLAALSMQRRTDTHDFIAALRGSHHYILDYLTDEVLRQQSDAVQTFLLRTAVLDRLCGPLCDTVADHHDSWALLKALERANLFIVPLDNERHWYRYHQLFADALRVRLQQTVPDQLIALHRRAALWYAANGWAAQAVSHALAAGDLEHAAHLIEQTARTMLMRGEQMTLLEWFAALPEPLIHSRPQLSLERAWALVQAGRIDAVDPYLHVIEHALQSSHGNIGIVLSTGKAAGVADMRAEVLAIHAHSAAIKGGDSAAITLIRHASQQLPPENVLARADLALSLGRVHQTCGDLGAASAAFAEAVAISLAGGNVRAWALAMHLLADVLIAQGQPRQAAERYQQALQVIAAQGWQELPAISAIYIGLGALMYEWNELAAAEQRLTTGIGLASEGGETDILILGYVGLSRLRAAQGNTDNAMELLQKAGQLMPGASLMAFEARLQLAQGDTVAAARWVKRSGLHSNDVPSSTREMEYCVLVRILIAQNAAHETLELLRRLHTMAEQSKHPRNLIEILVLQALAYEAMGDTAHALVALQQALTNAEGEGYIRTIIDEGLPIGALLARLRRFLRRRRRPEQPGVSLAYVNRLLLALMNHENTRPSSSVTIKPYGTAHPLAEPLTEREREVLSLLAAGYSSQQIADQLVITISTVKAHIHNIYGKLAVQSRTRAIVVAREHGLLE